MKIALKLGLAWPDIRDLYDVAFNGVRIGRVWLARDRSPAQQPWEWLISLPMALPNSTKGAASTLNDALNAFAAAWAQVLSSTQPARLQRALDLAEAVEHKEQLIDPSAAGRAQVFAMEHVLELSALDLADEPAQANTARLQALNAAVARRDPPLAPRVSVALQAPSVRATSGEAPAETPASRPAPPEPSGPASNAPARATPKTPARLPAARPLQMPPAVTATVVAAPTGLRRVFRVKPGAIRGAPATATTVNRPTNPQAGASAQQVTNRVVLQRPAAPAPAAARSSGEIIGDMEKVLGDAPSSPPPVR